MPLAPSLLAQALSVATDAAREAGVLLLAELDRPEGPRGSHDHAPVDTEVERLLRDRLLTPFPGFGFRGEETGEHQLDRQGTFWLVDPNDGTRGFLEGQRGSAVSIALLHQGRPVLGVVFAFAAPDDDGDLFCWHAGGSLLRNGLPVSRACPAGPLEVGSVVLLSAGHEPFPVSSARFVAPARFRCVPSAAYRLALVAAGEADVAVSTGGPHDWDLAAGHALLLAVGAELLDERGAPVRYDGPGVFEACYGGSTESARELVGRGRARWQGDPLPTVEGLGLVAPCKGERAREAGVLRRAQGCLLGQLAGDALGGQVEFDSAERIAAQHPRGVRWLEDGGNWGTLAGQPTDDSEMALTLARSLVRERGYEAGAVLRAYRGWVESDPFDIGTTTLRGIQGQPIASSEANGSLMRIAPLAIWGQHLEDDTLAAHARSESALTHVNPVCQDACAVFTVAVAHAIRTGAPARDVHGKALQFARSSGAHEAVLEALERAEQGPPVDFQRSMGWVLIALQNAFFRLLHSTTLEDGVVDTVGCGGDTDTNGAIAGALLGAVHGREGVPQRWRRALLGCRPLPIEGVLRPRPVTFWPVDALVLAERLLLAHP
jgi:ADP-ribosylglycohydrolase/fructose-1,6-bisphosphatase/inositol monophosphatase family enzyme